MNLSVIGLGKLGLCTAVCFALKGFRVLGFDIRGETMESLRHGMLPIEETGLEEAFSKAKCNIVLAEGIAQAVLGSDITFIIVPTPSLQNGRFDNAYVEKALVEAGFALRDKNDFHVIDVVSTVMPGSSEAVFRPLLEKTSRKQGEKDFGLVYNPEFIALGSVIRNFLHPDMVLIGASDKRSAQMVKEVYEKTCEGDPEFAVMSLTNAEIAKLSLNCFVTMKISFANELALLCESIPRADIDVITHAIGLDGRVGARYLAGGLGFGGPCFPRDNRAFQACADEFGGLLRLSPEVMQINDSVYLRVGEVLKGRVPAGGRIAVLGLSYKPFTHITEESQSLSIVREMTGEGYRVTVHDPRALAYIAATMPRDVLCCSDPYECVKGAHAVLLATPWPEYLELDWEAMGALVQPNAILFDCWRMLKACRPRGFEYVGLGLGPTAA